MTKKKNQRKSNIEFNIQEELEFWNNFKCCDNSENKLISRFKKICREDIEEEAAKNISDNMIRIVPEENQPLFFLNIYLNLPKKECTLSKQIIGIIKQLCKSKIEQNKGEQRFLYSIGEKICSSDEPETIIKEFLKRIQECVDNNTLKDQDIMAISYIWLVQSCKEYDYCDSWKRILIIEKVFVELFRLDKEKDRKACVIKSVPEAIANNKYRKQFLSLSYLYVDDRNKLFDLKKNEDSLNQTIKRLQELNRSKQEQINELKKKVEVKDETIAELKIVCSDFEKESEQLKQDLVLQEKMLGFEKNRFEQQYISKAKNLMWEVEQVIGLEITGIEGVANRLPERESNRILHYINRIRERITELGGIE